MFCVAANSRVGVRSSRRTLDRKHLLTRTSNSGLDARHMISRVNPPNVKVLSLTTIATPHRGSAFADYIFSLIGTSNIPKLYKALDFFGSKFLASNALPSHVTHK